MKNILFYFFLILFISGCVALSKTAQQISIPKEPTPIIETEAIPKAPSIMEQPVGALSSELPVTKEKPVFTYYQITNLISEFLDIQPVREGSGEQMFTGTSENSLVGLKIIGSMDNVSEASMSLSYPKDIEAINFDLNNAMMLRFLRNIAPEFKDWSNRTKDILNKFYAMNIGETGEERIVLSGKTIQVLYDRNINSISLTVGHDL